MENTGKERFYVSIGTQEISRLKAQNNDDFVIYANPHEIIELRELFDEMYDADNLTFLRAHVPIMEYHNDASNDQFDQGMINVFQKLYDLGDEKTRSHIKSMGILENPDN
ncbi:hydrolase [Salirhabdus sp. Marseille-P4669]|uniref:hydrolase n=1 Tax=Salirhabdus sp. Marseille-P4669 TaxID=2042310 RepID=UPI000C7E182F|nr:hydrolase [Salirhabdus sp. Marseille-P4669]